MTYLYAQLTRLSSVNIKKHNIDDALPQSQSPHKHAFMIHTTPCCGYLPYIHLHILYPLEQQQPTTPLFTK